MAATVFGALQPGLLLAAEPWVLFLGAPVRDCFMETAGSPRFLGEPCRHASAHDPAAPNAPRAYGASSVAFTARGGCRPRNHEYFWAFPSAYRLAVYASQTSLPSPTQDSLPARSLGASWAGLSPAGSRCQVSWWHPTLLSSWPRLSLAHPLNLCASASKQLGSGRPYPWLNHSHEAQ